MYTPNVSEYELNVMSGYTRRFVDDLFSKSGRAGIIGAFEGGNYQSEGIHRPAQDYAMFTRSEAFCAVCAEAIGKVIDEYTLAE